jgi:DNA-binding winged helix-turn-helix (wHTH) protein
MNQRTTSEEAAAHRIDLGSFQLDLMMGELLTASGELADIRRQALEVLLLLGRRSGQVVSKDDLMASVWPKV